MKTPEQVLDDLRRRLASSWTATLADSVITPTDSAHEGFACSPETTPAGTDPVDGAGTSRTTSWPHDFPLGRVTAAAAEKDFSALVTAVHAWRDWATDHQVALRWENRRLLGTPQQIPTHLSIPSLDEAARLVGAPWPDRLRHGRRRAALLATRYPHLITSPQAPACPEPGTAEPPPDAGTTDPGGSSDADNPPSATVPNPPMRRILSETDPFTDTDFDLLCRAADWFTAHDATGLTPRQVPIEGLHAKWLNTRRHLVRALAGVDGLGLLTNHPPRIHFTYLDPSWRAHGERLHDSATVGDTARPGYQPTIVVISENKDTALYFPPISGGISVEGVGRGGSTIAAFDWITRADQIYYWGDMDADGLEILHGFRAAGIPAASILMDLPSYEQWERFGTPTDAHGRTLTGRTPKPLPLLTASERSLYENLCNPDWTRFRRIEQERIPLHVAQSAVLPVAPDPENP